MQPILFGTGFVVGMLVMHLFRRRGEEVEENKELAQFLEFAASIQEALNELYFSLWRWEKPLTAVILYDSAHDESSSLEWRQLILRPDDRTEWIIEIHPHGCVRVSLGHRELHCLRCAWYPSHETWSDEEWIRRDVRAVLEHVSTFPRPHSYTEYVEGLRQKAVAMGPKPGKE